MTDYRDLRAVRPVRHFIAVTVFRALWWPIVGLLLPFALIGALVDWLSWTAFPAIAKAVQPIGASAHAFAVAVGNLILGRKEQQS